MIYFLASLPAYGQRLKAKMPYYTSVIPNFIREISIGKAQLFI